MKAPQLLPTIPMERYGLSTSTGKPLYRVVWSDSRTYLLGGKWPDGACEYRECELYEGVHAWILEKYMTAQEFAGSPRDYQARQFDPASGLLTLGPYPTEGDWAFVYQFPIEPSHSMISVMVRMIEASRNLTAQERMKSIMDPLLARQKRAHERIDTIFDESQPAFRYSDAMVSAANPGHVIRRTPSKRIKDIAFKKSAEELGMPMTDNAFFTGEHDGNINNHAGGCA